MLSATRSQSDDTYKKDYKFVVSDKENVPAKRETDMLILAKDTGKQFTSSSVHVGGGEAHAQCPLLGKHGSYCLYLTFSAFVVFTHMKQSLIKQLFFRLTSVNPQFDPREET